MTSEILHNNTLKVETFGFAEFLEEFQQAVQNGYILDLEVNEHYPQKYSNHLSVILKKSSDIESKVKPGRKARSE